MSKLLILVFVSLLFLVILAALPANATISSSLYHNGGSIIINTKECSETSDNLFHFGTTNDFYKQTGKSQTILSLGRTGIKKQDSTQVETLGMLNAFDSAGMFSTQTNIPESICDATNFLAGYGNTSSSRYPETQSVEGLWGLMGSGPGTSYESQVVVDDTVVGVSVSGTTPSGYLYEDVKGSIHSGFDVNSTDMQYAYSRHDHGLLTSDDNKSLDAGFDWLWDTSADETVNESANESVSNETEEGD